MIASLDERYDLHIYLEDSDLTDMKNEPVEGILLQYGGEKKTMPLSVGVNDIFAMMHGDRRTGAYFEAGRLELRLSGAAYADLQRDRIFPERWSYMRDGSKLTICRAEDPRQNLAYLLLQEEIASLEGFKA